MWILFAILFSRKEVLKKRDKSRTYSSYSAKVFSGPNDPALCRVTQALHKSSGVVIEFRSLPWGCLSWSFRVQDRKPQRFSHLHSGRLPLKVCQVTRLTHRTPCLRSALVCSPLPLVTWSPRCKRYRRLNTVVIGAFTVLAGTGTDPALQGCCARASPLWLLKPGEIKVWHRAAVTAGQLGAYRKSLEYRWLLGEKKRLLI